MIRKSLGLLLVLAVVSLLSACRSPEPSHGQSVQPLPSELTQTSYLYEIVRHLYRWQLDESEVERIMSAKEFVFWVRPIPSRLDPDDHSQFAEILLPRVGMGVKVKKADYHIDEMGVEVKSSSFRIVQVTRGLALTRQPQACAVVAVDVQEMRDYLFRTRNQLDFPDPALVERLRVALRRQAAKEGLLGTNAPTGEQVVHLAPLSPVANETWVFWEGGHKLFHFASDIDLANPAVWEQQTLMARIYDLDHQVVVTHEEAPGSNRFLTRYQVSRALFNCILLGQRVTVPPFSPGAEATPRK